MNNSLSKFKNYHGNWYTYKETYENINIEIKEPAYTLNFGLNLDHSCKSMVYFRSEDYKEQCFGDRRIGPKDCDLTVLEDKSVYQFEIKDTRAKKKNFNSANEQINMNDNLLKSILWFIDSQDMCGLKNFNSEHIIIHIRQRDSLERGIDLQKEDNYTIVKLRMDRKQKSGKYNLRKIIKAVQNAK